MADSVNSDFAEGINKPVSDLPAHDAALIERMTAGCKKRHSAVRTKADWLVYSIQPVLITVRCPC